MENNKRKIEVLKCCFCGKIIEDGFGNNPSPLRTIGRCCDECNSKHVVPYRWYLIVEDVKKEKA